MVFCIKKKMYSCGIILVYIYNNRSWKSQRQSQRLMMRVLVEVVEVEEMEEGKRVQKHKRRQYIPEQKSENWKKSMQASISQCRFMFVRGRARECVMHSCSLFPPHVLPINAQRPLLYYCMPQYSAHWPVPLLTSWSASDLIVFLVKCLLGVGVQS